MSPAPGGGATGSALGPSILSPLNLLPVAEGTSAGDVLVLDAATPGALRASERQLDPGVAGCALEDPEGVQVPAGRKAVGTTGAVLCKVDATFAPIATGDLLTTSATPGHAMRAGESAEGAILGKAMEPLAEGTGLIHVLVSLR